MEDKPVSDTVTDTDIQKLMVERELLREYKAKLEAGKFKGTFKKYKNRKRKD